MLRRRGKSTKARKQAQWQRENSEEWRDRITTCEVRFDCCVDTYGLAPAHSKDRVDTYSKWRSDAENEADFKEVVAACEKCHWRLDREMPKDERLHIVKAIIARRSLS